MYPDAIATPAVNTIHLDGCEVRSELGVYAPLAVGALVLCDGGRHDVFRVAGSGQGEGAAEYLGTFPTLGMAMQAGKHHPKPAPWQDELTRTIRVMRHDRDRAKALADAARRAEAEGMLTVAETIKAALEDNSDG